MGSLRNSVKNIAVEVKFGKSEISRLKLFRLNSQIGKEYECLETEIIGWLSDDPLTAQVLQSRRLLLTQVFEGFNKSFELSKDHIFSNNDEIIVTFIPRNLMQDMLQVIQPTTPQLSSPTNTDTPTDADQEISGPEPELSPKPICDGWDEVEMVETFLGECLVQKMKGDGDCVFAAITHQLFNPTPYNKDHQNQIREARIKAAEFILEHRNEPEIMATITGLEENGDISEDDDTIEFFLERLKNGHEWGGEESIYALSIAYNCKITVHQESKDCSERPLTYNPEGNLKVDIMYRLPIVTEDIDMIELQRNHYDSLITINEAVNGQRNINASNDDEEEDFSMLEEHFSKQEFKILSTIEKKRLKAIKNRYLYMKQKLKMPLKLPDFMDPQQNVVQAPKPKGPTVKKKKNSMSPTRSSTREASRKASSVISSMAETMSPDKRPAKRRSLSPLEDSSDDDDSDDDDSDARSEDLDSPGEKEVSFTGSNKSSPSPSKAKRRKKGKKTKETDKRTTSGRRIPVKKIRLTGQFLSDPCPLPRFSASALKELKKKAHRRKVHIINTECKAFIRTTTGDDYLTKTEYNNFCKAMVKKYPKLKSKTSKESHTGFKKSLSSSFRAERLRELKKAEESRTAGDESDAEVESDAEDFLSESEPENDENEKTVEEEEEIEVRTCSDILKLPLLLEKTKALRHEKCLLLKPWDIFQLYNHLRTHNMMIYDFALRIEIDTNTLHENFEESMQLLSRHYKIKMSDEHKKLLLLMKVHEFFVTKQVKDGAKPAIVVRDVKEGQEQLSSSDIQAPFLVMLTKVCIYTGNTKTVSCALMMQDRLILSIENPTTEEAVLALLASYFTLNVEYPPAYMQFLRALERLMTGKVAPSQYGNTKVKFERFISMLRSKDKENKRSNSKGKK